MANVILEVLFFIVLGMSGMYLALDDSFDYEKTSLAYFPVNIIAYVFTVIVVILLIKKYKNIYIKRYAVSGESTSKHIDRRIAWLPLGLLVTVTTILLFGYHHFIDEYLSIQQGLNRLEKIFKFLFSLFLAVGGSVLSIYMYRISK